VGVAKKPTLVQSSSDVLIERVDDHGAGTGILDKLHCADQGVPQQGDADASAVPVICEWIQELLVVLPSVEISARGDHRSCPGKETAKTKDQTTASAAGWPTGVQDAESQMTQGGLH
jgi:hypothetical protein